ncbi:MAG: low molecular weight phosphatase [Lysobacterales bacterium]|nr:MAG: low molecular weight phosphatase [Xanthomonadales bacterium]
MPTEQRKPREPRRVLFLCTHNSARSIIAEALFNHLAAARGVSARAESAGSAPSGRVQPLAMAVLEEAGIAFEGLHSKTWDPFLSQPEKHPDLLITVCDSAAAEVCPVFLAAASPPEHRHWPLPDPSRIGTPEAYRATLAGLRERIESLLDELSRRDRARSSSESI